MKISRYIRISEKKDKERAQEIFTKDTIYFPSFLTFNDPYDCKALFHFSQISA